MFHYYSKSWTQSGIGKMCQKCYLPKIQLLESRISKTKTFFRPSRFSNLKWLGWKFANCTHTVNFSIIKSFRKWKNVYNAIFNSNYTQWQMMRAFSLRLRDLGYFFFFFSLLLLSQPSWTYPNYRLHEKVM